MRGFILTFTLSLLSIASSSPMMKQNSWSGYNGKLIASEFSSSGSPSRQDGTDVPKEPRFLTHGDVGIRCKDTLYPAKYIYDIATQCDNARGAAKSGWEWGSGNFYPKPYQGFKFRASGPYQIFPLLPTHAIWKTGQNLGNDFLIMDRMWRAVGAIHRSFDSTAKEVYEKCEIVQNEQALEGTSMENNEVFLRLPTAKPRPRPDRSPQTLNWKLDRQSSMLYLERD